MQMRNGHPLKPLPPPPAAAFFQVGLVLDPLQCVVRVPLWRALFRVHAWADTPPERRERLHAPLPEGVFRDLGHACAHAPGLIEALGVFTSLFRAPHRVEAEPLAEACRRVGEWADEQGMLPVAVLFAEAAAAVLPGSPARANEAAYLCRRDAQHRRALDWYRRAAEMAVRGEERRLRENQREAIRALIGSGTVWKELGRHDKAEKLYNRAARKALHAGMNRKAAEVRHDLLLMCAEAGSLATAEWHARMALKLYSLSHPRLPYLTHDFAFLLVRQHHYTPALAILEKLLPVLHRPGDRFLVWSTLAWTAGGAGRQDRFEEAEQQVLALHRTEEEHLPAALNHLAEGAYLLGRWESARQYAEQAVEAALNRKDALVEQDAQELLERIGRQEAAPGEKDRADQQRMDAVIREFSRRMQRWKALAGSRSRANPDADAGEAA